MTSSTFRVAYKSCYLSQISIIYTFLPLHNARSQFFGLLR